MHFDFLTILGPTASGKTKLAAVISEKFKCEIVSADSRQVYKRMNIGTGKDLEEYKSKNIQYHLIDLIEPSDEYNLFRFINDFHNAYQKIKAKHKIPLLVGGTGLYLSSVLQNYLLAEADVSIEEYNSLKILNVGELKKILTGSTSRCHNTTDLKDKERLIRAILVDRSEKNKKHTVKKIESLTIGIKVSRDLSRKNITERLKFRLKNGMIEEVRVLMDEGISNQRLEDFGLEYRFISQYLNDKTNYNDMFQKLNSAIHNFAKRQMTWFRKMEREGMIINWFGPDEQDIILTFIETKIKFYEHSA